MEDFPKAPMLLEQPATTRIEVRPLVITHAGQRLQRGFFSVQPPCSGGPGHGARPISLLWRSTRAGQWDANRTGGRKLFGQAGRHSPECRQCASFLFVKEDWPVRVEEILMGGGLQVASALNLQALGVLCPEGQLPATVKAGEVTLCLGPE